MGSRSSVPLALLLGMAAAGCQAPKQAASKTADVSVDAGAVASKAGTVAEPTQADTVARRVNEYAEHIERVVAEREQAERQKPKPDPTPTEVKPIAAEMAPTRKPRTVEAAPVAVDSTPAQITPQSVEGDFGDARPDHLSPDPRDVIASIDQSVDRQLVRSSEPNGPMVDPMASVRSNIESIATQDPRDVVNQFNLQLVRLLQHQPVPSIPELAALTVEDREILSAVFDGLSNYRTLMQNEANPLASAKARPFMEMAERIRSRTDLTIPSMALCDTVRAFGNYDPIEPARFTAGTGRWVIFYCEVDGFLPQVNEKQMWETKLALELRLFSETGLEVWSQKREEVIDQSRKRRRDFFVNKKIQISDKLSPGRYFLKASVRDMNANRVAESTLPVDVVAR
jgi:hypothetical protein